MNSFIDFLVAEGFTRTNAPISGALVVHAVAGAGKSTLIRKYIQHNPNARAFTHGIPDPPNITSRFIQPFQSPVPGAFNILDEYCAAPLTGDWDVLLADPLQHRNGGLVPHYIKECSHRLGPQTCSLLRSLGIHITSTKTEDTVNRSGLFDGPIYGQPLALDSQAGALLASHGIVAPCPTGVLGREFPIVTVVSTIPLKSVKFKHALYGALSRHINELHVRAPPDPDTAT